jgi:indolepyruvate ferredoxin oxidoreductase
MNKPIAPEEFEKIRLQDRYILEQGVAFMSGMQALVRLPMTISDRDKSCGLRVGGYISGYRGSPLGTYDMALESARAELSARAIEFQPGVNEELAATAVWGSQQVKLIGQSDFDGVFGIWYGKAPGVDRTIDVFRHGNQAGTTPHGGVLAIAGDDPNAVSSTVTGCSDYNFVSVGMPLLYPASVQEMLDFGVMGIELSRYSGCWVGMKVVTDVGEGSAVLDVDIHRVKIKWPPGENDKADIYIRWPDNRVEQERRLYETKLMRARRFAQFSGVNVVSGEMNGKAQFGIISAGKPWSDLQQALQDLGLDDQTLCELGIRVLKLGMIYPINDQQIQAFADGLQTLLVVEEKRGFIEDQVKSALYGRLNAPAVVGKVDQHGKTLIPSHGETSPALVAEVLATVFASIATRPAAQERLLLLSHKRQALQSRSNLPTRTPYFCSGCPHNSSTKLPEGSLALGGIGCHWLALFMDRGTETFTQMGGEGAPWLGAQAFCEREHVFANLGDGTYHHSGVLAIRAAVYGNANITYKILYNDAVAMTGGQMISDTFTPQQISAQVLAEGVKEVVVVTDDPLKYREMGANGGFPSAVTVHPREELDQVQRRLRNVAGVTVLLYDQTCAAEKRRRRKRGKMIDPDIRAVINERVCEGCGDCSSKSNCISVEPLQTVWGRKRQINQSACNKDLRCVDGFCPSFVTISGAKPKKLTSQTSQPAPSEIDLAPPPLPVFDRVHETVITGIGGTGVITIGAILAMAARLEGKWATCLDQTGISQKNGAVLSHVRIGPHSDQLFAARVSTANADLVLGCDMMVAASVAAISTMDSERTRVVLNTHLAPHAEFVLHPVTAQFGEQDLQQSIEQAAHAEHVDLLPATKLATTVFGDAIAANMIILGYALQRGWIPVSLQAIERAIELNGVAINANLAALKLGREAAVDLAGVKRALTPAVAVTLQKPSVKSLDAFVQGFVAELTQYQNTSYATQYLDAVQAVRDAEQRVEPGSERLTRAVALQLARLMAYKDEYEIARLYTDGGFMQRIAQEFDGDVRLTFHLAPPLLAKRDPITGHLKKRAYGPWVMKAFGIIRRLKFLRGSVLDPFGYNAERKLERLLASSYLQLAHAMARELNQENFAWTLELANAVADIRGFGHVKEANMQRAINRLETLAAGTFAEPIVQVLSLQIGAMQQRPRPADQSASVG